MSATASAVRVNLAVGLAGSVWAAVIGLASIPFFLKFLGVEAYGLIGFFATTQALLQILDLGISPTISREIARGDTLGKKIAAGNLLHTLAVLYWCLGGVVGVTMMLLAPSIVGHWLQPSSLPEASATQALTMMGGMIAIRWPISLYLGAITGAQRSALASGITAGMGTFANLGAIAILAFASPTIEAFFAWQLFSSLIHVFLIRHAAWKAIGGEISPNLDFVAARQVWRFSAGMSAIALSSIAFTQLDKLMLSRILPLPEFGYYMLATVAANGLYLFIVPVYNIIYPRFSALIAAGDVRNLERLYRSGTRLMAIFLFPLAMVLVLFPRDLILLWTQNPEIATRAAPVLRLLAAGSALHGVMYFPYSLQIAHGNTKLPLCTNLILTLAMVPLIVLLSLRFGPVGAASAWLILHVLYVLLGSWLTHRTLLKGIGSDWLLKDVGIPLATTSAIAGLGTLFVPSASSPFVRLVFAVVIALSSILVSLALLVGPRKLIAYRLASGRPK